MIKYLSNKLMGEFKMQIIVKNGNKETIYELIYDDSEKCVKRTPIEYSPKFKSYYNFDNFYAF